MEVIELENDIDVDVDTVVLLEGEVAMRLSLGGGSLFLLRPSLNLNGDDLVVAAVVEVAELAAEEEFVELALRVVVLNKEDAFTLVSAALKVAES